MGQNCIELLEETYIKFKDKTAFVDARSSITFSELRNNSIVLSYKIPAHIIDQPILIYLPKSIESIISIFGILYSGNFYVPVDINLPAKKLKLVFDNLKPILIITNSKLYNKISSVIDFPEANFIIINQVSDLIISPGVLNINLSKFKEKQPAYCIYTSGSTGNPKGVLISHRSLINFINWASKCFGVDCNTILGNQSPLFFDVSVMDIFLTIKNGSTTYLIPEILFAFPAKLIDFICLNKINHIIWVPSVLSSVARSKSLTNKNTSLRNVLFAGEPLNVADLNYWRNNLKSTGFHNLYGPTEATVISTYYKLDPCLDYDNIPIGKPIDNVECIALDENGKEVEVGMIGELYISGISLALSYWNNSFKTSEDFRSLHQLGHGSHKWYRTGDLVKLDKDKNFIFIGRKDTQIKFMGYRIELGEIENAVSKLDFVYENCVVFDNQNNIIILFVTVNDQTVDEEVIQINLMKSLPKYMLPKKIIKINKIPHNRNGKIDRNQLINTYKIK